VNLAVMYGAKFIDLYTYFARGEPDDEPCELCNQIVNHIGGIANDTPTVKYYTLRDTINPRLEGLFGKTIKKLNLVNDFLGINALIWPDNTTPYEFINYVEATGNPEDDTCLVELGIFENPQDLTGKYFMPLNRYYSTKHNLTFGLRYLTGYKNWKVTDYVDTLTFTLVSSPSGTAE